MYYGTAESWNLRDRHMFDTLKHLMDWRGSNAKAMLWAHNSHIGNAAATDMGQARDEINIGQLCREEFGDDAALIGFGFCGMRVRLTQTTNRTPRVGAFVAAPTACE